ncbi:MAG TPA: MBL fold metallo-hydrolase, partial [Planctomycetota bacterium]
MPHLGCDQETCAQARAHPAPHHRVAALAIVETDRWWLVDATPDMPAQIESMGDLPLAGILLTHAHMGHYTGLMYLGRESVDADHVPVYASRAMSEFLTGNAPWSQLVAMGQIELHPFESGHPLRLGGRLQVTPWRVPHRDEFADTHGFEVEFLHQGRLLYVPDIDRWESWDKKLADLVGRVDYLVIDGSFFSGEELPGRDMTQIPHPTVLHTMDLIETAVGVSSTKVIFTHLNHTNPLWDTGSEAAAELERRG